MITKIDYISILFPFMVLFFACIFVFSPLGMGYNPFNPITVIKNYHTETVTIEGKYYSATDETYNVFCDKNIMYSVSGIVYTNLTIHHTYTISLKTTNTTLNMNGAYWGNANKMMSTTTIDHIIEEKL